MERDFCFHFSVGQDFPLTSEGARKGENIEDPKGSL